MMIKNSSFSPSIYTHYRWFYWQVRKEQNEELKNDGTAEEGGDSTDSEASGTQTPEKERF